MENEARQAFHAAIRDDNHGAIRVLLVVFQFGVVFVEEKRVVKDGVNPVFKEGQFTDVNDEIIDIELLASKRNVEAPVMPVDLSAMPLVFWLPVGRRQILIMFNNLEHRFILAF